MQLLLLYRKVRLWGTPALKNLNVAGAYACSIHTQKDSTKQSLIPLSSTCKRFRKEDIRFEKTEKIPFEFH